MKSTLAELKSPRELLGRLSLIPCMPIRVWPSFKSVEFSNKALYQEGVVGDAQTRQRLTILYCPHCTSLCYTYIVALHVALLYLIVAAVLAIPLCLHCTSLCYTLVNVQQSFIYFLYMIEMLTCNLVLPSALLSTQRCKVPFATTRPSALCAVHKCTRPY